MKPDYWIRAKRSLARRDAVMARIMREHPLLDTPPDDQMMETSPVAEAQAYLGLDHHPDEPPLPLEPPPGAPPPKRELP